MPLAAGAQLGPYEIVAQIGAGGMGEVYRARDTRLNREVAVKISNENFSDRFEREARSIAALNHPNICQLYDVGPNYLVMELIDGEPLRGPLPLKTALDYAGQIAEALEAAHEKGTIHRDLKPANIKVTHAGAVKVLDFGLAKNAEAVAGDPERSPTITISPTRAGMILGTAAYMSPEQARGKPVDARSDVWSFGAVVYEMLTGEQAFSGESVSDILASVLKVEPDWTRLPRETPAAIRNLLRRCLTKDRRQRLQAIGEARIAIEEALQGKSEEAPVQPATQARFAWVLAALMTVIAGAASWAWLRPKPPEPHGVIHLTAEIPPLAINDYLTLAISHDGSRLAFVSGSQRQIYVRMLDQPEARPIPGTEGSSNLRFSPDGQWISFVEALPPKRLKKVALAGGPPQVLAELAGGFPDQDWGPDDNILFDGPNGTLMRIPATGGKAETVATPDPKKGEQAYYHAQLLPGGEILIWVAAPSGGVGIKALNPKTGETKMLVERAGYGRYVPLGPGSTSGYIVGYVNDSASLTAVPFDVNRLEVKGPAVPVVDGVVGFSTSPYPYLDISDTGTLAYIAGSPRGTAQRTLVWVDRKGVEEPLPAPPQEYAAPRISPDGQNITLEVTSGGDTYVAVYDLARGTLHRITAERRVQSPVWTPDGKRLLYGNETGSLFSTPADGSAPPTTLLSGEGSTLAATSVAPDGKTVVGSSNNGVLWLLPLPEGGKLQPFLESQGRKVNPALSPDGHWVAYRSNEAGSFEIYVVPFPGPGGKFLISTNGGHYPQWSRDGRELFYESGDYSKLMAVDIQTRPAFQAGKPRALFEGNFINGGPFDVSPDGKRFLMVKAPGGGSQAPGTQVTVVLNWFEELRRRAPVPK